MQKLPKLDGGRYYHIYNRGIDRQNIFFEARNYHYFLTLYANRLGPVVDTYAYCLMKNHFHLLVRIKTELEQEQTWLETRGSQASETWQGLNPTQQFSNFFNSYAKSINKAYHRTGSLFQKRFGRIEVDSDAYFSHLVTYIHHNPQKHGFVADFRTYPYSSYRALLSARPTRLKRNEVLAWFNGVETLAQHHHTGPDEGQISHLIADDFV